MNRRHLAEIGARWVSDDEMPPGQMMVPAVLGVKLGASIEVGSNITFDVPSRIATLPARLYVA